MSVKLSPLFPSLFCIGEPRTEHSCPDVVSPMSRVQDLQLVSCFCVALNLVTGRESCIHGDHFLVLSSLTAHLGKEGEVRGEETKGLFF